MNDAPRVLLHNDDTKDMVRALTAAFPDAPYAECNDFESLAEVIRSFRPDVAYSVRFRGTPDFPRDALFGPGGPRWVSNGGVGTDHYGQWDPSKTVVTNSAGVAAEAMAEYILGCFLHFTLDVPGLQEDKAAKVWRARTVRVLRGSTLLIIGLGHTGQALAAKAKAFGMEVNGTRARPHPMDNVDAVHGADELHSLLPHADFIAVATPLIPATRGLLGPDEFAAMKPGVILADVSRGGVIDQTALHAALMSGKVGGAGLDVFETEPLPPESPLWTAPNAILSPHCSSVHDGWEAASFEMFIANLQRWIDGDPLENVVNPVRGY